LKTIEIIYELVSMVDEKDKIKVGETIVILTEYVTLVAKKNVELQVYSTKNKGNRKEIEGKYQKCIDEIKFLNSLSEEFLGEKVYKKEFERDEVEKFLQELLNEIFVNRIIARK
jgi:hypothetical protein